MGRKSSIEKLSPPVKQFIEQAMRENKYTIVELFDELNKRFPDEAIPSRSAIGRFSKSFNEMMQTQRSIEYMSNAMVAELGENPNDKTGAFLAQAVTALATNATMGVLGKEPDEVAVKEVLELARAAKYAQEARALSRKERLAIEKDARERLLREQEANLEKTAKAQGMSAEQVQFWREKVLGIQ